MVRDGIYYSLGLGALGTLGGMLGGWPFAVPAFALAAFVLYFFRDPERTIPAGDVVVSPADGRVVDIREADCGGQRQRRISIFLSVFDVHVNRSPMGGVIREVSYRRGRFCIASRLEASTENEQNLVTIEGDRLTIHFKQIAGLLARRIVFRK